ncbi:MAG: BrnT family toxin [Gemmatimonadetes bacterium]|nr:BrnT family toxin [Gemmatimonadota bacterium]
MGELQFEWDPNKATSNERKHGVSFDEASTVFSDDHAILLDDTEHSDDEDRFLLLGLSSNLRTIVVCHAYRTAEDVIRLISARKATRRERRDYARGWKP